MCYVCCHFTVVACLFIGCSRDASKFQSHGSGGKLRAILAVRQACPDSRGKPWRATETCRFPPLSDTIVQS